jgi:hypothetical protein
VEHLSEHHRAVLWEDRLAVSHQGQMMKSWRLFAVLALIPMAVIFLFVWPHAQATRLAASLWCVMQPASQERTPTIEEYQPKSTLVVKEHKIDRAKYPFIDIHSHHWNPTPAHVQDLIKGMDSINLRVLVNLSGGTGRNCEKQLRR